MSESTTGTHMLDAAVAEWPGRARVGARCDRRSQRTMSFPFLQRTSPAEHARQFRLAHYAPVLPLDGLVLGVDNLRHDVFLSPKFCEHARAHIARLLAKHGKVEDLIAPEPTINAPRVKQVANKAAPPPADGSEFKRMLAEVLAGALNRARREANISVDVLARVAVLKFLRAELHAQYADVLQRCRTKLRPYDSPSRTVASKS